MSRIGDLEEKADKLAIEVRKLTETIQTLRWGGVLDWHIGPAEYHGRERVDLRKTKLGMAVEALFTHLGLRYRIVPEDCISEHAVVVEGLEEKVKGGIGVKTGT